MMSKQVQPVGPVVNSTPASHPGPVTLARRFGTVVRLAAARTAAPLWRVFGGHDEIWTYISGHGPFTGEKTFTAWLEGHETQSDPYYFTVHDLYGRALGFLALMHIRRPMRVIEIGSIVYSSELQRTPLGTEAQYLLARLCFRGAGLSPLRMEMRFAQRFVAARRLAFRLRL